MWIEEYFCDVLIHDSFVEAFVFLLIPFDEEGSWLSEQDVDNGHVEEVLGSSYVGQLDRVAEEDIAQNEKVDIGPVGGDNDEGT